MKKIPNSKATEIDDGIAKRIIAVPVVSGELEVEYQVNENLTEYDQLATALGYNGSQKNSNYPNYLSGPMKSAWLLESAENLSRNNQRTIAGFSNALIGSWKRFYGQRDLRKAGLKLIRKLKWLNVYKKYHDTPIKFTLRVKTLYGVLDKLDQDPGLTPMPTERQRKEILVESFPRDYQQVYDLRGGR